MNIIKIQVRHDNWRTSRIEGNREISYELSFLLDDFHNVALLGTGDNASSQLLTQDLHLLPTPTGSVHSAAVASVRVRGGVLQKLFVRAE